MLALWSLLVALALPGAYSATIRKHRIEIPTWLDLEDELRPLDSEATTAPKLWQIVQNGTRHTRAICGGMPDPSVLNPTMQAFAGYSRYIDAYWVSANSEVLLVHLAAKPTAPNLYLSGDGGTSFSAVSLVEPVGSVEITESEPIMIYLTSYDTAQNQIYVSDNLGSSFSTISTSAPIDKIIASPVDPNLFIALSYILKDSDDQDDDTSSSLRPSSLYFSRDGGQTLALLQQDADLVVIAAEWVKQKKPDKLPSIFVVTKELRLYRWESPFDNDMFKVATNVFNFEQASGWLYVANVPDTASDDFNEKNLWVSQDDGTTFKQCDFPFDDAQGIETHFTLIDASEGVSVVSVEHQGVVVNSKYIMTVTRPSSLISPTEIIKADFTPDTIDDLGEVVLNFDPDNYDGCGEFSEAFDYSGQFLLVQRGLCPFTYKVDNAEDAGAAGVIVFGLDGDDGLVLMSAQPGVENDIPAFYVGNTVGKKLQNFIMSKQGDLRIGLSLDTQKLSTGTLSRLYLSDQDGVVFTNVLDDVVYDTFYQTASPMVDSEIVDVIKIESQPSTYIANVIVGEHFATMITFNKGATWQPITAPAHSKCDSHANGATTGDCSLHLTLREHNTISGLPLPISAPNAVGLIIATGLTGSIIPVQVDINSLQTYISHDGGCSWFLAFDYVSEIQALDHGGILTSVQLAKKTKAISYSIDYGLTWASLQIYNNDISILGLIAEAIDSSTVFAYFVENYQWKGIKVDFLPLISRQCDLSADYDLYSPSASCLADSTFRQPNCIDGIHTLYRRRRTCSQCFNGQDFDKMTDTNAIGEENQKERCTCTSLDFKCSPGFVRVDGGSSACVLDYFSAATCQSTAGVSPYELIPGDGCHNTDPDVVATYTATEKPECKGVPGSTVSEIGLATIIVITTVVFLILLFAGILFISKTARTRLVRTVDPESRTWRLFGWFRCFRATPATNFVYSQLAQEEDDDIEFSADGKEVKETVPTKVQIRRNQFTLDDDDDDDEDLVLTATSSKK